MKDAYERIPLMFRAQIDGRCQLQYLVDVREREDKRQDAEKWADEWLDSVEEQKKDHQFSSHVQTKTYKVTGRFITNSGQDEGVTRPVIGAKGFPYYPGSSMKGAFLRACPEEKCSYYCGYEDRKQKEAHPGILRFHGGYPSADWNQEEIVDVVHPQQGWQTQTNQTHKKPKGESAFIQISLHQPELTFGISSKKKLSTEQWQEIWQIWEKAIAQGIGTRVSAGYGQVKLDRTNINSLMSINLKGQGLASQVISGEGEFRPNMFKAALRGHTLRLLGGVTSAENAEAITKKLWGGFGGENGAIVGELGIAFNPIDLDMDYFTYTPSRRPFNMPIYDLKHGALDILAMGKVKKKRKDNLKIFLTKLIQFSLLLGGFGKSWRRIDHRLFFEDYLDNGDKPMIGCHWQLVKPSTKYYILINQLSDITTFLNDLHENMKGWVKLNLDQNALDSRGANWRESFKKGNVQIWGRIAEDRDDSEAVYYFHEEYKSNQTIKKSDLTGKMSKIGRMWHRMYPRRLKTKDNKIKPTREYVELLTIFPDDSDRTHNFLTYLDSSQSEFERLW